MDEKAERVSTRNTSWEISYVGSSVEGEVEKRTSVEFDPMCGGADSEAKFLEFVSRNWLSGGLDSWDALTFVESCGWETTSDTTVSDCVSCTFVGELLPTTAVRKDFWRVTLPDVEGGWRGMVGSIWR